MIFSFDLRIIEGFFLGLSLIAAIGAQNLFVIRQGILGQHLFLTAGLSALCDIFLIGLGTMGAGTVIANVPWLRQAAVISGVMFLGYYGLRSFLNVARGQSLMQLATPQGAIVNQKNIIASAIGFSLLNPHAYLDTVVLIGGISAQFETAVERMLFALGASASSIFWFFSLAYGARLISPFFRKQQFAIGLDILSGTIMFWIAWSLIQSELML